MFDSVLNVPAAGAVWVKGQTQAVQVSRECCVCGGGGGARGVSRVVVTSRTRDVFLGNSCGVLEGERT